MRFLDYKKVKDVERERGKELFGSAKEPSELASKVYSQSLHYPQHTHCYNLDYGRKVQDLRRPISEWRNQQLVVEELSSQTDGQRTKEGRGIDQECKESAGYHTLRERIE